ncbi:MAG: ABC transporter ATP-binding protein [bacterium]|nr:ABC transporter ATP-binding protein [bacterium]
MKLILDNITKSFEDKKVLRGASYSFEKGKIYGLLGRNGAGKTTLFNCIDEEIPVDSGIKYVIDEYGQKRAADQVGFVYANPVLPEFLTGYEYIKFFIDINYEKIKDRKTVEEYLRLVRLEEEDWHRLMKDYSHGMKNKMQLLCVFITKPLILLLDEPLTSFDVVVSHEMKELLKAMKKDHIIIFSTHILQLATDICDEIVILNKGTLSGLNEEEIKQNDFEDRIFRMLDENEPVNTQEVV